jgi:uncharacterized protein (TIGR03067 family)
MGEESSRTHDVFLSYSSQDKTWADSACAVLERHRVRCWIAPRDITPGDEWGAAIIKGLNGSRIMVLIFSGQANASEQVRREVERAGSQGMIILPFRVEDVRPEGAMEFTLSNRHWLDAFTPPVERKLELLARSVKTLLSKEAGEATEPPAQTVNLPAPVRRRLLIAVGFAVLGVIILAGSFLMFRNKTVQPIAETAPFHDRSVQPIAETAPRSDQERIQGRWQTIEAVGPSGNENDLALNENWVFKGSHLTTERSDSDRVYRGSFSLSTGVERKLFDFVGTNPWGKRLYWLGIYEFEGEFLKFCYVNRYGPNDTTRNRPESYVVRPGTTQQYRKFRRLGDH